MNTLNINMKEKTADFVHIGFVLLIFTANICNSFVQLCRWSRWTRKGRRCDPIRTDASWSSERFQSAPPSRSVCVHLVPPEQSPTTEAVFYQEPTQTRYFDLFLLHAHNINRCFCLVSWFNILLTALFNLSFKQFRCINPVVNRENFKTFVSSASVTTQSCSASIFFAFPYNPNFVWFKVLFLL